MGYLSVILQYLQSGLTDVGCTCLSFIHNYQLSNKSSYQYTSKVYVHNRSSRISTIVQFFVESLLSQMQLFTQYISFFSSFLFWTSVTVKFILSVSWKWLSLITLFSQCPQTPDTINYTQSETWRDCHCHKPLVQSTMHW